MPSRSNSESEPLLIDRAAAAEIPSADSVREWARERRAFISSVMAELAAERQAVAAGLRGVGLRAIMFEEFGGRDADPEEAYLAEVEGSDIYIGILGRRYGKPLKTRFSATHTEYLHAEKHALRMAVWTSGAADREGHEQAFLDEVRTFHVVPAFRTEADLQRQVEDRMHGLFTLKGYESRQGGGKKDIAALFTYAVMDHFLKDGGVLALIVHMSLFKASGSGEGYRRFQLGDKEHFCIEEANDFASFQPFQTNAKMKTTKGFSRRTTRLGRSAKTTCVEDFKSCATSRN